MPGDNTEPSASQLRDELQRLVVAHLLGPAGGPEETVDERTAGGRPLVGILAPKGRGALPEGSETLALGRVEDEGGTAQPPEPKAATTLPCSSDAPAFCSNAGLGFATTYLYNGEYHGYVPDFVVGMCQAAEEVGTSILETKGYDPLEQVKTAAALRWVAAINPDGQHGHWGCRVVHGPAEVPAAVSAAATELAGLRVGAGE